MNGPPYTSPFIAALIAVLIPVAGVSQDPVRELQAASQSGDLSFGGATNVSINSGNSMLPVLKAGADDVIHLVWMDSTGDSLEIFYSSCNGSTWSPAVNISDSSSISGFPAMTVDTTGTVHVVWMDGQPGDFDIFYSHLTGKEWSRPLNISDMNGISQRPKIVVDSAGTAHVVWYDNSPGSFQLFHSRLTKDGWSAPTITGLVSWYITDDPEFTATPGLTADSRGHVHVIWVDIYDGVQNLFHSDWNGNSWSKPDNTSLKTVRPREPAIEADHSGDLHLAWMDEGEVWYCRSVGKGWSEPLKLSDDPQKCDFPALTVTTDGDIHLAWSGAIWGTQQIFYRRFENRKGWSETAKVAEEPGQPYAVSIALDKSGSLHFAWMGGSAGKADIFSKQGSPSHFTEKIRLEPKDAREFHNRATTRKLQGQFDEAVRDYTEAIRLDPGRARSYNDRGTVYWEIGEMDKAVTDFTEAIRLDPKDAGYYYNRGCVLALKSAWEIAITDQRESIRVNPEFAPAYDALAWLLATCPVADHRNGERAVQNATKACQLTDWGQFSCLKTLAAAYAESGDFGKAVEWQTKAKDIAPASERAGLQNLLDLYQAGKPFRQTGRG